MSEKTVNVLKVLIWSRGVALVAIPSLVLLFSLCGCRKSPSTPEELINEFLRAAKAADYAGVIQCMPAKERQSDAELKKKDSGWYAAAAKEKGSELSRQYQRARIIGTPQPSNSQTVSSESQALVVRVANVAVETRPGNTLVMDQKFIVREENGRWVIDGIEPAPLTE